MGMAEMLMIHYMCNVCNNVMLDKDTQFKLRIGKLKFARTSTEVQSLV